MSISSPGIGSNLDVNSIVQQLMAVESRPLSKLSSKEASFQAKLSAYGSLNGALSSFQSSVAALSTSSKFQGFNVNSTDSAIVRATANSQATASNTNINVLQIAQAQTLSSSGLTSNTTAIGMGTISFQFGNITQNSTKLSDSVAQNGIAAGSLSINGTVINTSASTTSAKALATQINFMSNTTGVSATAQETNTATLGTFTTTADDNNYSLAVNGVSIISGGVIGTDAAAIDVRLADNTVKTNLANAGIIVTGSAVGGDLKFKKSDGSNITVQETGVGTTGGFTSTIGIGTPKTYTSAITLSSNNITIGGTNSSLAGLTSGTYPDNGIYPNSLFAQDSSQAGGTVTIDASNNSLQGIRDSINKANIGVTASIISDGSATPYHLILTSTKTGQASSMKISVSGDSALQALLNYNPADSNGQNLTETSAAKNTVISANGVTISSASKTINDGIQGINLTAMKVGSATITASKDTASVSSAVNGFVKAYNDLNKTIGNLSSFDAATKKAGPLLGDSTLRTIQSSVRNALSQSLTSVDSPLKTLRDIGVSLQNDGNLVVNTSKLQNAIDNNFGDIAALFAVVGTATDSLASVSASTAKTMPGNYALNITKMASQGAVNGTVNLNSISTSISASTSVNVEVDGVTRAISLEAGNYSATQLATLLQVSINGNSEFSSRGIKVQANIDGSGFLNINSLKYGSSSSVSITSLTGTSRDTFLGSSPSVQAGQNVEGSIGGIAAKGSGQTLTALSGSEAEGMQVNIIGGSIGARGSINFTRGYADILNTQLGSFLGTSGSLSGKTNGLNTSIKDIDKARDALNNRLALTEKRLRAQFTALDVSISSMSKTSNFLTQQLAALSSNNS